MGISGLSFNAKHAGTIKPGVPHAKHANVWKPAKEWWERKANVWSKVWSSLVATVTGNFFPTSVGDSVSDRATCGVVTTPTSTPTAWVWAVNDQGGWLVVTGANSAILSLRGPTYNPDQPTTTFTVAVNCTITVNGQTITTPTRTLTYEVGGFV